MNAAAIESFLGTLVGQRLSIVRRCLDMRGFHFGDVQETDKGSHGQYILHVQCPWRVDGPDGIVTGRDDLWESVLGEATPDDWSYKDGNSVQDVRLRALLEDFDRPDLLVVESVEASDFGDVVIYLSGDYRIRLFPGGTVYEAWRFFTADDDGPYLVVPAEE